MTDGATSNRRVRGLAAASLLMGVAVLPLMSCTEGSLSRGVDLPYPERATAEVDLLHRMLIAEDSRATTPEALAPLIEGLASTSSEIRRIAVRGLGRLERAELVERITPLLSDEDPAVRAEAANALAQAVSRADPATVVPQVRATLISRLESETDTSARGALAESVGRTRHANADQVAATANSLAVYARAEGGEEPVNHARDVRVTKALYLLGRQPAARGALPDVAIEYLRSVARAAPPRDGSALDAQRARTVAVATIGASGRATAADLESALEDPDPLVRREAMLAAPALSEDDVARSLLMRGLEDPAPTVRYDAVRGWGRVGRDTDCTPLATAARDVNDHVALLAIDLLAGCPGLADGVQLLDSLAQTMGGPVTIWHRAAHAVVSLAAVDSTRAANRLPVFVTRESPFIRTYAATTAAALKNNRALRALARDTHPNVRVAAIDGLKTLEGEAAVPVLIEQLTQEDPQLVMTAAQLLSGTSADAALPAVLDALDRFTARQRETERDARMALIDRVVELGSVSIAERLRPLLEDYDPEVAGRIANTLSEWTRTTQTASPQLLPFAEVPSPLALDSLERSTFTVEMAGGGTFQLRLRAWDAPTNAYRFARLAEGGYFDGLTYHRVVPNFVVQGGSPNANEYAGDGPFTRDELGLDGHWRGTVGISTRGRDTGDGQMFFNLVDNVRLDHEYTVIADVVSGMDVVDRMLEGATIQQITRTAGR